MGDTRASSTAVTAVVPCFNAARWIRRSLESILGQSRPVDEIIVVDDGSTDSSAEIIQEYPVRLLRLGANRGASAARNVGLEAASCPLIAWLDADDQWDPHHCATLVPLLSRHPEAAVAFSRVRFASRQRRAPWGMAIECGRPASLLLESLERCVGSIIASVTRREAVRAIGGFREELSAAGDFDLFLRLSARYPFVWSTDVTASYYWRHSQAQISADAVRQLRCLWRSRLLFWRELETAAEWSTAARVLSYLRELWARDLAQRWRRRDLAALSALFDLPDAEALDGVLSTRLRGFLARPGVAGAAVESHHRTESRAVSTQRSELMTVAIATRNRSALLKRVLDRLAELDVGGLEFEVVVIDNASDDDTSRVLCQALDLLPLRTFVEATLGSSHARNRAMREARGTLVVWTDDDVLVNREWLQAYSRAARRWPAASFFGGPIRPKFEAEPPDWLLVGWPYLAKAFAALDLGGAPLPFDRRHVPFGPNFAVRTAALRSHPFDTELGVFGTLRVSGEETDLLRRLLDDGHTGRWIPDAVVEHVIGPERLTLESIRKYFMGIGRSMGGAALPSAWFEALEAEREYRRCRTSPPSVWIPKLIEASIARGRCWRGPVERRLLPANRAEA